jgi:hypothetical protein
MLKQMPVKMWLLRSGFVALMILNVCGCSEETAKAVVPAKGTLTIDGVGAANIMVRFVPDGGEIEGNLSSSGVTDEQGKFQLVASDGRDGAIPGPGHVLLVDLDEERPAQGEELTKEPRLHPTLAVLSANSLTAEVAADKPLMIEVPVQ